MTNTNGSTTATVETLTAEVRVLQVGNRQVTLSVVNQLDRVRYSELEPMGRVHSSRKDMADDGEGDVEVVGRDRRGGALVFAYAPNSRQFWPRPSEAWAHWSSHMMHYGLQCMPEYDGNEYNGSFEVVRLRNGMGVWWRAGRSLDGCPLLRSNPYRNSRSHHADYSPMEAWLHAEWEYLWERGDFCDLKTLHAGCRDDVLTQVANFYTVEDVQHEAEALPLIVLAGLR